MNEIQTDIEHEAAARRLWMNLLREADKDNEYNPARDKTDFAGAFRKFDNFYLWLCLHQYKPGMKVYRYSPAAPFSADNCAIECEKNHKSIATQAAELAEYERRAGTQPNVIRVEGMTLTQIAMRYGVAKSTLLYRYRAGVRSIEGLTQKAYNQAQTIERDSGAERRLEVHDQV